MSNLGKYTNILNEKSTRLNLILTLIMLSICLLSYYIIRNVHVFSDGVYHAAIIDNILSSGNVSMQNPLGYNDFFMDDIQGIPKIGDPIMFYLIGSSFSSITGLSGGAGISELGVFLTLLSALLIYLIAKNVTRNKGIAVTAVFLFALAPISYWILSHRLIESLLYFYILLVFYLLLNSSLGILSKKRYYIICFLCVIILNIKLTSAFFLLFSLICILFLKSIKIKEIFIGMVLCSLLLLPFIHFYQKEGVGVFPYKGISYNQNPNAIQRGLDRLSNSEGIITNLVEQDRERLRNIVYQIENGNYKGIVQYLSIFKVDSMLSNNHEYGELDTSGIFLILLTLFIISRYKNLVIVGPLKIWHIILTILVCSIYLRYATNIYRYGFYFNIICFILIFPALFEFIKSKLILLVLSGTLGVLLISSYTNFSIKDNLQYVYSFDHNPLISVKQSFYHEFQEFSKGWLFSEMKNESCIYTTSREFSYYSGIPKKWDSRINSLGNIDSFKKYYKELIGCKYIVTAKYGGGKVNNRFIILFGDPIYKGEVFYIYEFKE